jgi:Na+/phosphate symporter
MKLFSSTVLLVLVAAVAMSTDVLAAPLEARSITYVILFNIFIVMVPIIVVKIMARLGSL